jgi:hypothetical protein
MRVNADRITYASNRRSHHINEDQEPEPHQIQKIQIRFRIKVKRLIRIRIQVKRRFQILFEVKKLIWLCVKVKERIRILIKVMRIRYTGMGRQFSKFFEKDFFILAMRHGTDSNIIYK